MKSWRQVKLLLWKDYLIRKRKLVTLGGAVWATVVMLSLVIVRNNIDTQHLPTCQYSARALPSAGMLTFLQSFICSVNNECRPMDQYEEIPIYADSRIRKLESQFGPLLYNDTILNVAALMPDALKLVATFSSVIDEPDFHQIGRNGLHVADLFVNPARVKRFLSADLHMSDTTLDDVMTGEISFQGIGWEYGRETGEEYVQQCALTVNTLAWGIPGKILSKIIQILNATFDKCNPKSLSAVLLVKNSSSVEELSKNLCEKTDRDLERMLMRLLPEVNYRKYFRMMSNMLSRLSGESWVGSLGGLMSAALRLSRIDNFIPLELAGLLRADTAPAVDISVITKFMELFEPTFGDTEAYKSLRGITDTFVEGIQWLYKIFQRPMTNHQNGTVQTLNDAVSVVIQGLKLDALNSPEGLSHQLENLKEGIQNGFETMNQIVDSMDISIGTVFRVLSKVTSTAVSLLPPKSQHDVLYYSTLLTKLVEGAHHTVLKNLHMEEIMYNVSKRQPDGVKILNLLPASVIGKMFDALSDAERTQIFTSRITNPGQMFCDVGKLQNFFLVSKSEAEVLKKQMCNSAWKNYASDIINSFGIFDVKQNINKMASLVVAETLGADNSDNLYSIDKDFLELQQLVEDLTSTPAKMAMDWPLVLNISKDAELFKVVKSKMAMAKKILITVHGALAREVVKQNPILEAKITPILIHSNSLLTSLNVELESFPRSLVASFSEQYVDIIKLVMSTLFDQEKTFKALSTPPTEVLCGGVDNSSQYLVYPNGSDKNSLLNTLCQLSKQFDRTLDGESKLAKTIYSVQHDNLNPMKEVNWVSLVSQLKKLYSILEKDFGYVFAPSSYNMDNSTIVQVAEMSKNVTKFWFNAKRMDSALHISIKVCFQALDVLDRKLFNLSVETPVWNSIKHAFDGANSFLVVTNQMVRLITAFTTKDEDFQIPELPITVKATRQVFPNLPQLIKDTADVIIADNTSIPQMLKLLNAQPSWPCSSASMADILSMSNGGLEAVRGLELIMCNGQELQREWVQYVHAQKIRNFRKIIRDNTTAELEPHIFLKLSRNFDEFIRDLTAMDGALNDAAVEHNTNNATSLGDAVKYAVHAINESSQNSALFRKVFSKLDLVLEEIDTSSISDLTPTGVMWEDFIKCSNNTYVDEKCQAIGRAAWKYTFKYISMTAHNLLGDLIQYFSELNEPNANMLQILGFNRGTGLQTIYEKWPDFLGVLLNSFWDNGFMNQIRKATKSLFWDCSSIMDALVIPLDSHISEVDVKRVKPYVCPSVLYWISLPRGENTLLNLVAKMQYYFYTLQAKNLTSSFETAYERVLQFRKLFDDISKVNISATTFNETIEDRLNKAIDGFISWNVTKDNATYRLFNEINKKQFISTIYLTKIASILNKFYESVGSTNTTEMKSDDAPKVSSFLKLLRRRPTAVMEIYFDAITDTLWKNNENYTMVNSLNMMCENFKNNDTSKDIMSNNTFMKTLFCAKDYALIHKFINAENLTDMENSRKVLISFVQGLQKDAILEESDVFKFFANRKELIKLMKLSMEYSEELGLGIYVKYLQSNLQHYSIVLQFLSGEDWWTGLKQLYSGPYAQQFFRSVENSFDIIEDVVTHLDKIKIVRLLKDMNVNNTDTFCLDNLTLSDYIPDNSGALSKIKMDLCRVDKSDLFKELPPLLYASQGYDSRLKLSKDVDYASVDADIAKIQAKLKDLQNGPSTPMRPSWITDEKLNHLRQVAKNLFSKESLTKMFFGSLSNVVDAVTLFMNSSDTATSSMLTTWLRQINLQLIKKDEYDALLCHLSEMSLTDTYNNLKTNFHWDMAIKELISQRNYTKYELNKALNQFLEHVSSHILHSISANTSHLHQCLARDVSNNTLGDLSFHLSIVTKTIRMIRSAFPHLEEVEGIKKNSYLLKLSMDIAHRLSVTEPLNNLLANASGFGADLEKTLGNNMEELKFIGQSAIDLGKVLNHTTAPLHEWLSHNDLNLSSVCSQIDCNMLAYLITNNIDKSNITNRIPDLQASEFWSFRWLSSIFQHVESLLAHSADVIRVGSRLDLTGLMEGQMTALLDTFLTVLQKDNLKTILVGVIGITKELHPLLKGTELEFELDSVLQGLHGLGKFRDSIIEGNNLSVEVWRLIAAPQRLEYDMKALGINHTNFWSVAAPRMHAGRIDFKPLLTTKERTIRLKQYVCQPSLMSNVIQPANLDLVTADDVFRAVGDQFCTMSDQQAKLLLPAVLKSLNMTYIMNNIMDVVLFEVYLASNLTQEEGKRIVSKYGEMVSLMPVIQENLSNISEVMSKEPLLSAFKKADNIKGLLASSEFLGHAGNMLCGTPLVADNNRFYKAIAETKDFDNEADPRQLEALPSDFCRSMYKDILSMGGGKIVWSFVKPLVMGKILYTPDTPDVGQIMSRANSSFAHMSRMRDLITSFADAFSSIELLSQHKESLVTFRHLMNSARFQALTKSFTKAERNGDAGDMDFAKIFDELGDVKSMGGFVRRLADLLGCVNLNRFLPMRDELKLSNEAVKLTLINEFSAGIVFNPDVELPNNAEYKIRMDIESVPTTSRKRNQFWTPGPEGSFIENMRYFRGFVQIQDLIDKAIIQQAQNSSHRIKKRDVVEQESDWAVYTQQTPYPCYTRDVFQASLYESQALVVAFFFSLILIVSSTVRFTVHERESGNTTLMSVMGLRISNHTTSWFIASFLEMVLASTLMFAVLKLGGILPHSDPLLLWLMIFNFGFAVVMFCYMISKLFKSASLGSVCTCILYLMMFLPYIIVLSMEAVLGTAQKILTCLSMATAFCYSILYVARYEAIGEGAQWSNVWSSPESGDVMSIASTTLIVLMDAVLYALIGWFIEWFTEYRNHTDNLVNSTTTSEKAGISIVNVSKTYGEGASRQKLALDNVSIELNKGQITTLLGQNGAGKTTLIKIITGMLKPSKGSIMIRTEDNPQQSHVKLGVCPQNDVLLENLTAVEHLQFYALLKSGKRYDDVELEVQSMLHVLGFGGVAYEQVWRLSGGLRRRLCVALAFICRPQLVLLDEPSSGVDPVARRDTWSLIVKLKEDRTVLLTTHHLDEAEILSDQIVIMHKGRVHTTGSPIEIKRSLGNGYKLTAFYPKQHTIQENKDKVITADWTEDNEHRSQSIEESFKELLGAVRGVVKNAQLVDVKEREVEIALPFFDPDGLNNDFLALCKLLEKRQSELRFSSYSMNCSNLEQVFLNICQQADSHEKPPPNRIQADYTQDCNTSSSSSSHEYQTAYNGSFKSDRSTLVPDNGKLKGSQFAQYLALLHKRLLHYRRNLWLLTLLFVVPTVFVFVAMGFSLIRPPADNEVALKLHPSLYGGATEFLVPHASGISEGVSPAFAESVMKTLAKSKNSTVWIEQDNPECQCTDIRQECDYSDSNKTLPQLLILPNSSTVLDWAVSTQEMYIEKRYGGWSSSLANNMTNLVAWYNNKGHHAMPSYLNALNTAALRSATGDDAATITTFTHPLKISEEQLSKSTVLQHVADIGISAVILIGFSLIPAGSAIYLVQERESQQKRLQLLCGVTPLTYWLAAITWDMLVVVINIGLTVCVMEIFQLPVFVEKDNLPAICLLLFLFGWACNSMVHLCEKLFTDASLANMMLFCLNVFLGVSGLAILLILDIISDSDMTDNARWTLHKIFMLSPQFTLADGLIEIAKNTIQAQVLKRFGMDTYSSPLTNGLVLYHYVALALVAVFLFAVNLAIENEWIEELIARWRTSPQESADEGEMEDLEVATERYRVELAAMRAQAVARPTHLHTIGNINAGFVNTEGKTLKLDKTASLKSKSAGDVLQCLSLRKEYSAVSGKRVAVHSLTLGIPPGECLALLGENGAGKSTTFGMLTGELRATAGSVLIQENRVRRKHLRRGLISYCPQNDAVDPLVTVREQLRFYCRLRGIATEQEVISKTLELFDLKKYADQSTQTLSGGNKRKLCTAIAMMGRSPLILLDEPTSGMDPGARGVVARGVGQACGAGRAVLLSTHALDDARRLAHRLALLQRGRLRTVGPVQLSLERFGGGHVVGVRVSRDGDVSKVWGAVRARMPHALLQATNYTMLQFLLPRQYTGDEVGNDATLSRIFSELATLQSQYDIEDYTVNQSSLYQMFESFSDKKEETPHLHAPLSNILLPSNNERVTSEELISVTSL